MLNLMTVVFEAHNVEKNHHRRYQVQVGRDLLDHWTVAIGYGRVGQAGRETQFASATPDDLRVVIRDRLRRRLSAPKRIGYPYRLSEFSTAAGFDASRWLPGEVVAELLTAAG